jgi:hypothetical protein
VEAHSHDFFELDMILSGTCRMRMGDQVHTLRADASPAPPPPVRVQQRRAGGQRRLCPAATSHRPAGEEQQ